MIYHNIPCLNIMESQYLANWTSFHILIFVCICGEQSLRETSNSKQPNLDYSWIMDPSCLSPKGLGWAAPAPQHVASEKIREEEVGSFQVRAPEAIFPLQGLNCSARTDITRQPAAQLPPRNRKKKRISRTQLNCLREITVQTKSCPPPLWVGAFKKTC